uniref:Kassorin-M n=1 Tax=Phlyctimantis maculatus TaxID=2517390 RepID=KASSO_PHLMA|nr:RecName: Full=Kassorin-M; AltName: Full=PreproKassorin-M; Flags: Precursor [Kassina cochranae]CBK52153.1 Kassorin M precursor [Kassina cochranae]
MLTLKKSMLLLFFLGMVSFSLADDKREDEAEEGEDKRADEGEEKRAAEKKRFLEGLLNTVTGLLG